MARTALVKTKTVGQFGTYSANAADLTMAGADVGNKNMFVYRPRDVVIVYNSDVAPQTVTITSVPEAKTKRLGDIGPYTLAADDFATFGPFNDEDGFVQSDGNIYLEASSASVKFGVIEQAQ